MTNNRLIRDINGIQNKIYCLRGLQIMLDSDLARFYNVNVKVLNQAIKRNIERFPPNFMFQLSTLEYESLRSQIVTLNKGRGAHRKYLPYAFTEQGVAMLSGILKSNAAVRISIQIINAFVAMRKFISSNVQVFQRLDVVERKQIEHDKKFEEVFDAIQSKGITPEKGIFYDGQVFDAYKFVSDIVRSAHSSIILIDNYVDDTVLTLFCKRRKDVSLTIFTKNIYRQLLLDLAKFNSQYPPVEIKEFKKAHDRFLIVDDKEVYHFGASLKDLGKRWFGFSKFDKEAVKMLDRLGE